MDGRGERDDGFEDVTEIMGEIRRAVAERRRQGRYTVEDVERLVLEKRHAYGEQARIDPGLVRRLLHHSHEWNIASDYLIRTRRKGPLAWAILAAKRVVRPFVRLYTDHVFNRQAQLNLYVSYALLDAVHEIVRLEVELTALRHRVQLLEERGASSTPPPA